MPEVVRAICDYNVRFLEGDTAALDIGFNRELGWALIALCFGHELLGDDAYLAAAQRIVSRILDEAARTDFTAELALKGKGVGLTLSMLGTNFNVNTIPLGLKHYHQITGDRDVRQLLIDYVAIGMPNFNDRATGVKLTELWTETLGYVCELTGDDAWLEESLWQLSLFFRGFNALGWMPPTNDSLTTKAYCRVYRGLAHYVAALSRAGMLERAETMVLGLSL